MANKKVYQNNSIDWQNHQNGKTLGGHKGRKTFTKGMSATGAAVTAVFNMYKLKT